MSEAEVALLRLGTAATAYNEWERDMDLIHAALREAPVVGHQGTRVEGWAEADPAKREMFHEGTIHLHREVANPKAGWVRATLIIYEPPAPSSGSETI